MLLCPIIQRMRLDKWLWTSRIISSRSKASALILQGKIRINRIKVLKPSHDIKVGDVITVSLGQSIKVLQVKGMADRRLSAKYAQNLFCDLGKQQ